MVDDVSADVPPPKRPLEGKVLFFIPDKVTAKSTRFDVFEEEVSTSMKKMAKLEVMIPAARPPMQWPRTAVLGAADQPREGQKKGTGALCVQRVACDIRFAVDFVYQKMSASTWISFHDSLSQLGSAPFILRNSANELQVQDFKVIAEIVNKSPQRTREVIVFTKLNGASPYHAEHAVMNVEKKQLRIHFGRAEYFHLPNVVQYWAVLFL